MSHYNDLTDGWVIPNEGARSVLLVSQVSCVLNDQLRLLFPTYYCLDRAEILKTPKSEMFRWRAYFWAMVESSRQKSPLGNDHWNLYLLIQFHKWIISRFPSRWLSSYIWVRFNLYRIRRTVSAKNNFGRSIKIPGQNSSHLLGKPSQFLTLYDPAVHIMDIVIVEKCDH